MTAIDTVLAVIEILQRSDFVQVIFDFLDNAWRSILTEVVHAVKGLENTAPFLRLRLNLTPEVLHDHSVVLPVVGVVSQNLQLGI